MFSCFTRTCASEQHEVIVTSIEEIAKRPNHTDNTDIWYSFETYDSEDDELHPQANLLAALSQEIEIVPHAAKNHSSIPEAAKLFAEIKPYNTRENISLVNNKGYLVNCLSKRKQNMTKGESDSAEEEVRETLAKNYKKHNDGYIEMVNQDALKRQKAVLGSLIKQFGSAIFSGKSVMSISLPVTIFEARSQLEREAYNYLFAPHFLEKAGTINNPLEQFKLTVAHFIANLYIGINPQKPFNPILGETFQGIIGGCPVYAEQVSHHPPVSALQMIGKNFQIYGSTEFSASISWNSVKSSKFGYVNVHFKNTNATIRTQCAPGLMSGTAIGKRYFQFTDKYYLFDIENKYYTEINFDCQKDKQIKKQVGKTKLDTDFFFGNIWKISDEFAGQLKEMVKTSKKCEIVFKEKEHAVEKLDTIQGNWLEYLEIGGKRWWSMGEVTPLQLKYFDNPLPSDCNFRLDVLCMRTGEEDKAQEYKNTLEDIQRADRKLRPKVEHK